MAGVVDAQPQADVLQPDPGRSERRDARIPARIEPRLLHLQRRRKDVRRCVQHDSLRGPRAVDRSRRHEPPDGRRRWGRVDFVGPRPDVAVPRQPARRAVLRDQRRHAGSVFRLRRSAGQRSLVRAECHAHTNRHLESRWLQHRERRRLLRTPGSGRRAHRDHRIAGRASEPGEPVNARAPGDFADLYGRLDPTPAKPRAERSRGPSAGAGTGIRQS